MLEGRNISIIGEKINISAKQSLTDLILVESSYVAQDPGGEIAGRVATSPIICG